MSEGMTSDIRGLKVAERNTNELITLLQVTDSAIDSLTGNVQRMRELAVQSATGTLSDIERGYLQVEVDALTEENSRLNNQMFGDIQVFPGGGLQEVSIQIGPDEGDVFIYPHITRDIHSREHIDISTQAAAEEVIVKDGD